MNPLAIAVQGIGFAVVLVAVQGFAPLPVANDVVAPISGNYTTPTTQKPAKLYNWVKELKKAAAETQVEKAVVKAVVRVPVPTGEAATETKQVTVTATVRVPKVSGQASASFSSGLAKAQVGQIVAFGEHDLDDETILAMLLSLLVEAGLV